MAERIPTKYVSSNEKNVGRVANLIVSPGPCKLFMIMGFNAGPQQYIQCFFNYTVPADGGAPPLPNILAPANSNFSMEFGQHGIDCDALTICNSTTAPNKTAGAANCEFIAVIQG